MSNIETLTVAVKIKKTCIVEFSMQVESYSSTVWIPPAKTVIAEVPFCGLVPHVKYSGAHRISEVSTLSLGVPLTDCVILPFRVVFPVTPRFPAILVFPASVTYRTVVKPVKLLSLTYMLVLSETYSPISSLMVWVPRELTWLPM